MNLTWQILAAVSLDLLVGDPRWLPHPVRGIGWLTQRLECPLRRLIRNESAAGIVAVLLVVAAAGAGAWGLIGIAGLCHPLAADIVSVILIYTTIAAHDLARHSCAVFRALAAGNLEQARRRVAEIVGRDTANLDEAGVARAAVECVAESTVDGITAPLFFAILAGPVGAMMYRAINTLDSTFGYTNTRYLRFGWAAAKLDDLANYLPARVTAPLIGLAAAILGRRPMQSWRILRRDGRKHASPNSGLPEAAMAGALGVQLGGLNYYDGEPLEKPAVGEPIVPIAAAHILAANAVMFVTLVLFLALGLAVRVGVIHLWHAWRINA
ncbi:MAG: adenosylcobinamide-phosphate synthase CbiB [Verrucomicrobia bacterium]|nr:adenosylcobinamide-phosphate synthase CbiB [Verrucomicrobiota bacterium]MBU1734450.1 adenosylcobinamide-phosphate synthase CbiB [Verrucomicrobiota bacterium]MBU1856086.1 adenosylcobinamide-phosphate synthase CbiB [Verrucomicrobiota bacterium]